MAATLSRNENDREEDTKKEEEEEKEKGEGEVSCVISRQLVGACVSRSPGANRDLADVHENWAATWPQTDSPSRLCHLHFPLFPLNFHCSFLPIRSILFLFLSYDLQSHAWIFLNTLTTFLLLNHMKISFPDFQVRDR